MNHLNGDFEDNIFALKKKSNQHQGPHFKEKEFVSNRPADTHTQFDFDFTLDLKKALGLPRLTSVFFAFSI